MIIARFDEADIRQQQIRADYPGPASEGPGLGDIDKRVAVGHPGPAAQLGEIAALGFVADVETEDLALVDQAAEDLVQLDADRSGHRPAPDIDPPYDGLHHGALGAGVVEAAGRAVDPDATASAPEPEILKAWAGDVASRRRLIDHGRRRGAVEERVFLTLADGAVVGFQYDGGGGEGNVAGDQRGQVDEPTPRVGGTARWRRVPPPPCRRG